MFYHCVRCLKHFLTNHATCTFHRLTVAHSRPIPVCAIIYFKIEIDDVVLLLHACVLASICPLKFLKFWNRSLYAGAIRNTNHYGGCIKHTDTRSGKIRRAKTNLKYLNAWNIDSNTLAFVVDSNNITSDSNKILQWYINVFNTGSLHVKYHISFEKILRITKN